METKTIVLPKTKLLVLEYTLLSTAFLVPFFISGPQIVTGTIVNTLFFLYASQTTSKRAFAIAMLPSIGALLNGLIFGKFTIFLLYFLPFIWIGNLLLVETFTKMKKKYSFPISVVGSSILKCVFLFVLAYILTLTKVVPLIFLQLMGVFQLYTALMGGALAYVIHNVISQKE